MHVYAFVKSSYYYVKALLSYTSALMRPAASRFYSRILNNPAASDRVARYIPENVKEESMYLWNFPTKGG